MKSRTARLTTSIFDGVRRLLHLIKNKGTNKISLMQFMYKYVDLT